jgi:hypothetical protein
MGMTYGKYHFFHEAELSRRIPDALKSCQASGKGLSSDKIEEW